MFVTRCIVRSKKSFLSLTSSYSFLMVRNVPKKPNNPFGWTNRAGRAADAAAAAAAPVGIRLLLPLPPSAGVPMVVVAAAVNSSSSSISRALLWHSIWAIISGGRSRSASSCRSVVNRSTAAARRWLQYEPRVCDVCVRVSTTGFYTHSRLNFAWAHAAATVFYLSLSPPILLWVCVRVCLCVYGLLVSGRRNWMDVCVCVRYFRCSAVRNQLRLRSNTHTNTLGLLKGSQQCATANLQNE